MFDRLPFLLLASLLLFSPLVRGGNRQVASAIVLALSLALLALFLTRYFANQAANVSGQAGAALAISSDGASTSWWWWAAIVLATSPLIVALAQLVPLPIGSTEDLLGRAVYGSAWRALGLSSASNATSITPLATWSSVWYGVPLTASFFGSLLLSRRTTEQLLTILLCAALVQMTLSLFQLVQGQSSPFFFDSNFASNRISGTFNNRNHLADYFAMLIPVWFYMFAFSGQPQSVGTRLAQALKPLQLMFGFTLLVLILVTQSRGGVVAGSAALILSTLLALGGNASRIGIGRKVAIGALLAIFAAAAVLSVGLERASERFGQEQVLSDADIRHSYVLATLEAARNFWPLGSGVGSFEAVFPRFQALSSLGYVDNAHNDYLQLTLEFGAALLPMGLLLLVLVARQMWELFRRRRRSSAGVMMRWFAGVAVLALLLHSWFEFNLHIPALAINAAFLLGVFLRPIQRVED